MKHSYTSTNDYQICPARYFHKHVARDAPFEETEAIKWGNKVHTAMEQRLLVGKSLPEDMRQWEPYPNALDGKKLQVELRLGIRANGSTCSFYDDDCFWGCKIDVVAIDDPSALIFDWKTGKEREDPTELRMQAVLLTARFPGLKKIQGRYVWLKQNQLGVPHDLSNVGQTWAEMHSLANTIANYAKVNHWPEREGPLCAWCPVYQCRFNRSDALVAAKRFAVPSG